MYHFYNAGPISLKKIKILRGAFLFSVSIYNIILNTIILTNIPDYHCSSRWQC